MEVEVTVKLPVVDAAGVGAKLRLTMLLVVRMSPSFVESKRYLSVQKFCKLPPDLRLLLLLCI